MVKHLHKKHSAKCKKTIFGNMLKNSI